MRNVRLHMAIARKICLGVSIAVIVLWLLAWLPMEWLPPPLNSFLFFFGGILTYLLLPAALGVWWGMKGRSGSGVPSQPA